MHWCVICLEQSPLTLSLQMNHFPRLILAEDDIISSEDDTSSDRSTIRNIKGEITAKLLQEMSAELEIYKPV